jgi:hypothetical protein
MALSLAVSKDKLNRILKMAFQSIVLLCKLRVLWTII